MNKKRAARYDGKAFGPKTAPLGALGFCNRCAQRRQTHDYDGTL